MTTAGDRRATTSRDTWRVAVLAALLAVGCGPQAVPAHGPESRMDVGVPAPEILAERVSGAGPTTLAEAKGRVVIIDFWSTFCDPCERSFPQYQALKERFGEKLAVIAISVDSPEDVDAGALTEFARRTGAKFPILWDKDGSMKRRYQPRWLPTSFVVDTTGRVAHVHAKYEGGDIEAIAREVELLLAPEAKEDEP